MPIEPSFTSFTLLSVRSVKNDTPCFQSFTVELPPSFTLSPALDSLSFASLHRWEQQACCVLTERRGVGGNTSKHSTYLLDLFQICT